jgi:deoxyhypusine synthase
MGLSQARQKAPGTGYVDVIGDIVESANLIIRRPRTASIVLGGGTPKNFINQASVQAEFFSDEVAGHRYALQIITDVPHFGGASGSSLEEAQSWGKLATDAARVSVHADATIALPILASALAATGPALLAKRKMPAFGLASRLMTIDGQTVPHERFEGVNEPAV